MFDLTAIDFSLADWIIFVVAGVFTGIINTLAGSGSLITLPIFILICGLPAPVANGTNRIGVLVQGVVGIRGFWKNGQLPLEGIGWLIVPTVIGASLGALVAVDLDEKGMNLAIGILMVFMLGVMLINPKRWIRVSQPDPSRNKHPLTLFIFLLIGFYGGFIQAGVGIFLLAGLVLIAKLDLGKANGVKLLLVFVFNLPALLIFIMENQVHFMFGTLMAIFQAIGAYLGVRFVAKVPNANIWIHRLLVVIVAISALKFLGPYDYVLSLITE
ncbi:MAG: sulfite exporter TauE/SafE family protein [Bacteroidota bacterium]